MFIFEIKFIFYIIIFVYERLMGVNNFKIIIMYFINRFGV